MQPLLDELRRAGAKPRHLAHLVRVWLRGDELLDAYEREDLPLPQAVRDVLPGFAHDLEQLVRLAVEHESEDGGARLLSTLVDGRKVESVLLPRDGVCVSTQVGCAVGCTFCMTGTGGLERQLRSAEILAQVALARRLRPVRRVVFMGMGEPAHNLDAVVEAIDFLGVEGGVGHKDLVFSTVGERAAFERLARNEVKPALALSLHTTRDDLRAELLPRAPRIPARELVDLALAYAAASGHPLQVQWTLLAGVNDTDEELTRLADWFEGRRAVVNFIPYNEVEGLDHERTSPDRAYVMTRTLHARGITAKLRNSVAGDVDGACGQLRARA